MTLKPIEKQLLRLMLLSVAPPLSIVVLPRLDWKSVSVSLLLGLSMIAAFIGLSSGFRWFWLSHVALFAIYLTGKYETKDEFNLLKIARTKSDLFMASMMIALLFISSILIVYINDISGVYGASMLAIQVVVLILVFTDFLRQGSLPRK